MGGAVISAFRVKEQNPVIVAFLFGVLDSSINVKAYMGLLLFYGMITILISLLSFFINEYTDKDTDIYRSDKDASQVSSSQFWLVFVGCSLVMGLLFFMADLKWWVSLFYLSGISYSMPGIRLKKYFPYDQMVLAITCVILPYVAPFLISGAPINYLTLSFLMLYLGSANLIAVSKDVSADCHANLLNTGVVLGHRGIMKLGVASSSCCFLLGFAIDLLYQFHWYYFIYIFQMLLFCFFYKGLKSSFEDYRKWLVLLTRKGIAAGWVLVLFLVLVIVGRTAGLDALL